MDRSMKPEELRIGNYIKYHGVTYFIQDISIREGKYVSNLFSNPFQSVATHLNIPISDLKPLTLIKDWLIKFGFYDDPFLLAYKIELQNENCLIIDITNTYYYQIGYETYWTNAHNIEFVHILQNLYKALTDKELEIKTVEA